MSQLVARRIADIWTRPLKRALLPGGRNPFKIRYGPMAGLTMNLDLTSQTQLAFGLFERETMHDLISLSAGIEVAVDIGAAEGEYALYFAKKTSATKIHVVEPDAALWVALEANLKLNDIGVDPRLIRARKYVGPTKTSEADTLDNIVGGVRKPCLVKIDIDGGEVDALAGARQLIDAPDTRWLIETHSSRLERDVASILLGAKYKVKIIENAWWRFILPERRLTETNRWIVARR